MWKKGCLAVAWCGRPNLQIFRKLSGIFLGQGMNFHCNQHNVKANSAIYEKDNHDRNLAQSQTVLLSSIPIKMAIYFDHVCS